MKKPDIQTAMNTIRRALSVQGDSVAVVIQMAGQLIGNADHPDTEETEYLTTLMLAAGDATTGRADNTKGWANNVIFLMTNKVQELPVWFYRYTPNCKVLTVEYPREKMRREIISSYKRFSDWNVLDEEVKEKTIRRLVGKTDGFTCMELCSILELCEGKTFGEAEEKKIGRAHV